MKKSLWKTLLILYLIFLLIFVVLQLGNGLGQLKTQMDLIQGYRQQGHWNINLIPFQYATGDYLRNITSWYGFSNLVGNILVLVPLGFLLKQLYPKHRFLKTMLDCLIIVVAKETLQFVAAVGYFDVDDILLNMLGCVAGYFAAVLFNKLVDAIRSKHAERVMR